MWALAKKKGNLSLLGYRAPHNQQARSKESNNIPATLYKHNLFGCKLALCLPGISFLTAIDTKWLVGKKSSSKQKKFFIAITVNKLWPEYYIDLKWSNNPNGSQRFKHKLHCLLSLPFCASSFAAALLQMRFPVFSNVSHWLDTDSEQVEAETRHGSCWVIIATDLKCLQIVYIFCFALVFLLFLSGLIYYQSGFNLLGACKLLFYSLNLPLWYFLAYHSKTGKSLERKISKPSGHSPECANGFLEGKIIFLLEQSILKLAEGETVAFSMALSKEPSITAAHSKGQDWLCHVSPLQTLWDGGVLRNQSYQATKPLSLPQYWPHISSWEDYVM